MLKNKILFRLAISVTILPLLFCSSLFAQNSNATQQNNVAPQTLDYMSTLEKVVLDEMNLARTQPQKYADYVAEWKQYYTGKVLERPGHKRLTTFDGVAAVDEAIGFLRAATPLPPLGPARGLFLAARDHAKDLGAKAITGHTGSDGSTPDDRVERYGEWESSIGESIVEDLDTARNMVIRLLIDDGSPTRGHRGNIFNPGFKITGIAVGEPSNYGAKCVIDYVGGFSEKGESEEQPAKRRPAKKSPP
jgi:uncharacterized protein YkwD